MVFNNDAERAKTFMRGLLTGVVFKPIAPQQPAPTATA